MKYGYARVSTESQDLASQIERLEGAGCQKIYREKLSGKSADRRQLQRLLKTLKPGDVVYAVVGDRVARDPFDMLHIVRTVSSAGAELHLLDEPFVDTTSEMSDLIVFLWGWAAKWQRRRILENTSNGRARAMARGVKFGRKPKLTPCQRQAIAARFAAGASIPELAADFQVSESTIRRAGREPVTPAAM